LLPFPHCFRFQKQFLLAPPAQLLHRIMSSYASDDEAGSDYPEMSRALVYNGDRPFPSDRAPTTFGPKCERQTKELTYFIFEPRSGKRPQARDLAFVNDQISRSSRGVSRKEIEFAIDDYVMKGVRATQLFTAIKKGDFSRMDLSLCPTGAHDFVKGNHELYTQESKTATTEVEKRLVGDNWRLKCEKFVSKPQ
jgi:hypothetical protein